MKSGFKRLRIDGVTGLCFKYRRESWRVRGHVPSFHSCSSRSAVAENKTEGEWRTIILLHVGSGGDSNFF